jgi:hypothetical protein
MASGNAIDSSGNSKDQTPQGTPTYQSATNKLGISSVQFNGANQGFYRNYDATTETPTEYSMSTWIRFTTFYSAPKGTFGSYYRDADYAQFNRGYNNGGTNTILSAFGVGASFVFLNATVDDNSDPLATDTWYHVVATWSKTDGNAYLYVNGVEIDSAAATGDSFGQQVNNTMTGYRIGTTFSQYFGGYVDEQSFSLVYKTPEYVAAEYANQNAPDTFSSLGSEITQAPYGVLVSESVSAAVTEPPVVASASDSTTISENVSLNIFQDTYFPSVSDSVSVSENISLSLEIEAIDITAEDTVSVSESISIELTPPTPTISVSDSTTVTDTPNLDPPYETDIQLYVSEGQFANGYAHRKSIEVLRGYIGGYNEGTTSDVTLTFLDDSGEFATEANGGKLLTAGGTDIIFTDTSNTLLDFERVAHDLTTGEIQYRIRNDWNNNSASENTTIYVYYGKLGVADQSTANPYDTTYKAVVQMEGGVTDSSSFTHSLTDNSTSDVAGKPGRGREFDSTNPSSIVIPHDSSIDQYYFKIGMWVYRDAATSGTDLILATKHNGLVGWWFYIDGATNRLALYTDNGSGSTSTVVAIQGEIATEQWVYVEISVASTIDAPNVWIDGFGYGMTGTWNNHSYSNTGDLYIGSDPSATYNDYDGRLDQFVYFYDSRSVSSLINSTEWRFTRFAPAVGDGITLTDDDQPVTVSENIEGLAYPQELSVSDSTTVTEAITVLISQPTPTITVTDTAIVSENIQMFVSPPPRAVSVIETVTVSEQVNLITSDLFLSVTDSATVADNAIVDAPAAPPIEILAQETATVIDQPLVDTPILNIQASDTITVAEFIEAIPYSELSVSDSITVTDTLNVAGIALAVSASETVSISENFAATYALTYSASDTITVSESVSALIPIRVRRSGVTQDFAIAYDVEPELEILLKMSTSDTVSVSESVQNRSVLRVSAQDTVTVTDIQGVGKTIIRPRVSDATAVTDVVTAIVREPPSHKPSITETVTVDDTFISVGVLDPGAIAITVKDTVSLTENFARKLELTGIAISESVTVTDTPSAVTPTVLFVTASDTVTVTETVLPAYVKVVIPPAVHYIRVYDVTVVTERHIVDRDIWGGNIPDEEDTWRTGSDPSTDYTEADDPTTDWRDAEDIEQ